MTNENVSGSFSIWNILFHGVHLRNTPGIVLATSTLDTDI